MKRVFKSLPLGVALSHAIAFCYIGHTASAAPAQNLRPKVSASNGYKVMEISNFNDSISFSGSYPLFYYLQGKGENPTIRVDVTKKTPLVFGNNVPLNQQISIAAGFRGLPGASTDAARAQYQKAMGALQNLGTADGKEYITFNGKTYWLTSNGQKGAQALSSSASGNTLIFNVSSGAQGTYRLFGGINDLYSLQIPGSGDANNNTVQINFAGNNAGTILFKKIIGGRSAQMNAVAASTGFAADNNSVVLSGAALKNKDSSWVFKGDVLRLSPEAIVDQGVYGGEGYQANENYLKTSDLILVGEHDNSRHYGLMGGRGFLGYRLNTKEGAPESAIADNNIVVIQNSAIGLNNPMNGTDRGRSMSVFGGFSAGRAENNLVVLENSRIRGNVFGGLELQNRLEPDTDYFIDLDQNMVSLKNVYVESGSVYGTATGETKVKTTGKPSPADASTNQTFFIENYLLAVNRQSGVVNVSEKVQADSVYARFVQFGQYVDSNVAAGTKLDVSTSYFPSVFEREDESGPIKIDAADALEQNTVRLTSMQDAGHIRLGQQVAGSYLISTKGFRSDLSSKEWTPTGLPENESQLTNGMHNFWVGTYVNVADSVSADGTSFDKRVRLFNSQDGSVNHGYGESGTEELNILTQDDGMTVDFVGSEAESERSLMKYYRNHYQGSVLYVGVSQGNAGKPATSINYNAVEQFRKQHDQNTDDFGNTFVGVIKDGTAYFKGSYATGNTSLSAEEMTFDVPGFIVMQGGKPVAEATYGFYKYLHFDGKESADGASKSLAVGKAGGIGLQYWIKSLDIYDGETLNLKGVTADSALYTENFGSGEEPTRKQELYTISAKLEGKGNVAVAEGTSLVFGSAKTIYAIKGKNDQGEVEYQDAPVNTYTGTTTIKEGAQAAAGIDRAFGSESSHTSELTLEKGALLFAQKHALTVGDLKTAEGSVVNFDDAMTVAADNSYRADFGKLNGAHLTVKGNAFLNGTLIGGKEARLTVSHGILDGEGQNPNFEGSVELDTADAYVRTPLSFEKARFEVSSGSNLVFAPESSSARSLQENLTIGGLRNGGNVYLAGAEGTSRQLHIQGDYEGAEGSMIYMGGLIRGENDSQSDSIYVSGTASGSTTINYQVHPDSRGEKTSKGILVFSSEKGDVNQKLKLVEKPRIVDKDDNAFEWVYDLEARKGEDGKPEQLNWYLVNALSYQPAKPDEPKEDPSKDNPSKEKLNQEEGHPTPIPDDPAEKGGEGGEIIDFPDLPAKPELRPESGAYAAAIMAPEKMHIRLHDRAGTFSTVGENGFAPAVWVREEGIRSHFTMNGEEGKTRVRTSVTQFGADLIKNKVGPVKLVSGVFAGGLYSRAKSSSWDRANSRTDGYAFGLYATLFTGESPDAGFYADTWLTYGRYDNKVMAKERPTFDFKSHGFTASLEAGYGIRLNPITSEADAWEWTLQPQAQVIWDGVRADKVKDETDTTYRQVKKDIMTTRLGTRIQAKTANKAVGFAEVNWIHKSSAVGVGMGNGEVFVDGGRNLGELRVGFEGHMTKNLVGWAAAGARAGSSHNHQESLQVGLKYQF